LKNNFQPLALPFENSFEPLYPKIIKEIEENKKIYTEKYFQKKAEKERLEKLEKHNKEVARLYKVKK
tara:strand:+ start:28659 stop:28859 length:201 start_codon:yes stop_codon:yes gene_type:complete